MSIDSNNQPLKESAIGNRILWQGREYSFKTELYFFRNRFYTPNEGRWLSPDPIGIAGGLNQRIFCSNNPVNFRDEFGLKTRFVYGKGHAWIEITDSPYAGTYGYGAKKEQYLYWAEHPLLGFPRAIYNKGEFYSPDPFRGKYSQNDVCEKDTTPEME